MARNGPRRGASKPYSQRQVPGWVWLFTGVITGLFIAFLYHLAELRFDPDKQRPAPAATKAPQEQPATEKAPRFDFYAVLPRMEVIVPKGDTGEGRSTPGGTETPAPRASREEESYLLQAGSFRSAEDADRRRAELILQGFEVKVQPVQLESGDTWHRVMIGPFNNLNALHRAQDKMASVGVETLPIKVKKGG